MRQTVDTKNLRPGQEIYIRRLTYNHGYHFFVVKVAKVTPSGMVDVTRERWGANQQKEVYTQRFGPNGKLRKKESYDRVHEWELDDMPFAERQMEIDRNRLKKVAADALNQVRSVGEVTSRWDKDAMSVELDRLQKLIDVARAAVEVL